MTGKRATTERQRKALAEHRKDAPAAPKGNTRRMTHGTRSERALAPVRARYAVELRRDYPHLDDRRLALLADRLAAVELAARWLDAQGSPVRTRAGQVYDVADRLAAWNRAAWSMLTDVERERADVEAREQAGDFARWAAEQTAAEDAHVVEDGDDLDGEGPVS